MSCNPPLRSHIALYLQTENHKLQSHGCPNTFWGCFFFFFCSTDNIQQPLYRHIFCKSSNLSCCLLLNFEQITLSVLFVCVGDSRRFALFLSVKAVAEAHNLSVRIECEWKIVCVCGEQGAYAGTNMHGYMKVFVHACVCGGEHAARPWMFMWQDNKDIHVVGLHNNVCVAVCVCVWERARHTHTQTHRVRDALHCSWAWIVLQMQKKLGNQGPGRGHS